MQDQYGGTTGRSPAVFVARACDMTHAMRRIVTTVLMAVLWANMDMNANASTQMDSRRLAIAELRAKERWERLFDPTTSHLDDLSAIRSGEAGIIGLIVNNLDYDSPAHDEVVLRYVNDVLLPSVRNRRAEYICSVTKEFYYSTVPTSALPTFEMPGLSFIHELIWFALPTLPYLERENLHFSKHAWQFFEAAGENSGRNHFAIWNGTDDARLSCEANFVSWDEPIVRQGAT